MPTLNERKMLSSNEALKELTEYLTAIVVDVSAVLWTIEYWPAGGTAETFVSCFKVWLSTKLVETNVHLCFDRYFDYLTKSSTRSARANGTRIHQIDHKTVLPARDAVTNILVTRHC